MRDAAEQPTRILYVGSFTSALGGRGDGVSVLAVGGDPATPALTTVGRYPAGCPTFLAQHPSAEFLYAASEAPDGEVYSFAMAGDGTLVPIGVQATGPSPAHIVIGRVDGQLFAVTSHYWGGCFAVHRVQSDGALGPCLFVLDRNAARPGGPQSRAHCAVFAPSGEYLLATDLGQNEILTYRLDPPTGELVQLGAVTAPPGTGPRHIAWHRDGRIFVSGELGASILVYTADSRGQLSLVEDRSCLADPAAVTAPSDGEPAVRPQPAEIALSHGGRFVHIANRCTDVISTFATDGDRLRPVADTPCGGDQPRHFTVLDDELYVANQSTSTVDAFTLDPVTGVPGPTGAQVAVKHAACVLGARPDGPAAA